MKVQQTLIYTIKTVLFCVLFCASSFAQNDSIPDNTKETDTLKTQIKYGLRVGADLSKIVTSFIDEDFTGFEIMGDFRLTRKWYIAGEFGVQEQTTVEDFLNVTATGTYIKIGADYNAYDNWYGMDNMIYGGLRVAGSSFSQTLNSYTVYNQTQYWTPQFTSTESVKDSGLTAIWVEFIAGIKAEVLKNLFLGANLQFKYMISESQPETFNNLYVPGFNKTYESSNFGFGFGYNISYLIPIFKKDK